MPSRQINEGLSESAEIRADECEGRSDRVEYFPDMERVFHLRNNIHLKIRLTLEFRNWRNPESAGNAVAMV